MAEHTLLVTETGVEILTARFPDSPGGPIPIPAKVEGAAPNADLTSGAVNGHVATPSAGVKPEEIEQKA